MKTILLVLIFLSICSAAMAEEKQNLLFDEAFGSRTVESNIVTIKRFIDKDFLVVCWIYIGPNHRSAMWCSDRNIGPVMRRKT